MSRSDGAALLASLTLTSRGAGFPRCQFAPRRHWFARGSLREAVSQSTYQPDMLISPPYHKFLTSFALFLLRFLFVSLIRAGSLTRPVARLILPVSLSSTIQFGRYVALANIISYFFCVCSGGGGRFVSISEQFRTSVDLVP